MNKNSIFYDSQLQMYEETFQLTHQKIFEIMLAMTSINSEIEINKEDIPTHNDSFQIINHQFDSCTADYTGGLKDIRLKLKQTERLRYQKGISNVFLSNILSAASCTVLLMSVWDMLPPELQQLTAENSDFLSQLEGHKGMWEKLLVTITNTTVH